MLQFNKVLPRSLGCARRWVTRRFMSTLNTQEERKYDSTCNDVGSVNVPNPYIPNFAGEYIKPLQWKMYTKSHIPAILNTYWPRGAQSVDSLPYLAAASVLPMRTNNYVGTQLIDWSAVPDDPMFQLTFPQPGQWCHTFCTYCFRWAQFTAVGSPQAFQSYDSEKLASYIRKHKGIRDVLFTGGDPMVMTTKQLERYIHPLLQDPTLDHLRTIRIGTKSLAYWPYSYVTNDDADDLLRLFETVTMSGRHLAIMAHVSHPRELQSPVVREAIRRIRMTGAVIRSQAPLIHHVNADPWVWVEMWQTQLSLGMIPYYMFVERDTGAKHYFEVPLMEASRIYHEAIRRVSGVARTVRGPSMSAAPGKVHLLGTAEVANEKVFVLQFLQARNPQWTGRPFFAKYDKRAAWLDQLKPAFGEEQFFYENELKGLEDAENSSGVLFQYQ